MNFINTVVLMGKAVNDGQMKESPKGKQWVVVLNTGSSNDPENISQVHRVIVKRGDYVDDIFKGDVVVCAGRLVHRIWYKDNVKHYVPEVEAFKCSVLLEKKKNGQEKS